MTEPGPPLRGRVPTDGYLIDPGVIGEPAAFERVLATWQPGARLCSVSDGAWLLTLPATGSVRAEHAPGLPVQLRPDGRVQVWRHGHRFEVDPNSLPDVELSAWVDLADLPLHVLASVEPKTVSTVVPAAPRPVRTELRSAVGVGEDRATKQVAKRIARGEERARRRAGRRASGGWGASTAASRVPGPSRRHPISATIGWLVSTPVGALLRSRHERYLRSLADDFEHARFDEALRRAIALGGTGTGRLSVRLPLPRRGPLAPTPVAGGAGRGIVTAPTLEQYLRTLYEQAADDLERRGRIEEAAFVRADLLACPGDAVLLLERHGRYALAAELAEGRQLRARVGDSAVVAGRAARASGRSGPHARRLRRRRRVPVAG